MYWAVAHSCKISGLEYVGLYVGPGYDSRVACWNSLVPL